MKIRFLFVLVLSALLVLLSGDNRKSSAETSGGKRIIRFQVVTIEESSDRRKVLSETTIEGPSGTDFNINLQTGRFKMQARFLTDLTASNRLKFRADLNTRRLYGNSPSNLPLYEEDQQKQTLEIGFDESIVLLPFGRNPNAETLKIEITPMMLLDAANDSNLKIDLGKQLASGEIYVEAFKIPHRFETEAVLLSDGQEVARGMAENLIEEPGEIVLQPDAKAGAEISARPLKINLTVKDYKRNRPADMVTLNFNAFRNALENDQKEIVIPEAAGMGTLGGELSYQLDEKYFSDGKKYELKLKVRLSKDEQVD